MHTEASLLGDLQTLGIRRGDSVIVHTAFSRVGPAVGGVHALIHALIEAVLPQGALLLPNLNIPHEFSAADPPCFDLKHGDIRRLGITPTVFRADYAEHFSLHPTHSLTGIGDRAAEILAGHEFAACCCGAGTPWHRNALEGGKVLLIGCDQRSNTTSHTAEELMEQPYRLGSEIVDSVVTLDGTELTVPSRLHLWRYPVDFNILNAELEAQGALIRGRVGDAETLCLDAEEFVALALQKLAADRWYFLSPRP